MNWIKLLFIIIITLAVGSMIIAALSMNDQKLQKKILTANTNIDYYIMDMKITSDMTMSFLGQTINTKTISNNYGAFDSVNDEAAINTTLRITSSLGTSNEIKEEIYIIGNELYFPFNNTWIKTTMNEHNNTKKNQLEDTLELLEISSLERMKDEKINGQSYYVIKTTPNNKKLSKLLLENLKQKESSGWNISNIIKSYSSKVWINKKTFVTERTEIEIKGHLTEQDINITNSSIPFIIDIDFRMEIQLTDINKEVLIILPDKAKEARTINVTRIV